MFLKTKRKPAKINMGTGLLLGHPDNNVVLGVFSIDKDVKLLPSCEGMELWQLNKRKNDKNQFVADKSN